MADVLVPATLILEAIPRATSALQSTANTFRGAWSQEEYTLSQIKRAADIAVEWRFSVLISITLAEFDLIRPYLER